MIILYFFAAACYHDHAPKLTFLTFVYNSYSYRVAELFLVVVLHTALIAADK